MTFGLQPVAIFSPYIGIYVYDLDFYAKIAVWNILFHVTRRQKVAFKDLRDQIVFIERRRSPFFWELSRILETKRRSDMSKMWGPPRNRWSMLCVSRGRRKGAHRHTYGSRVYFFTAEVDLWAGVNKKTFQTNTSNRQFQILWTNIRPCMCESMELKKLNSKWEQCGSKYGSN